MQTSMQEPKLPVVLMTLDSGKKPLVKISKDFQHKYLYLCSQVPKLEWSGVLFYKLEGEVTNPGDMVMVLEDILLMDIGSPGFTSFTQDTDVSNHLAKDLDWQTGLIHSHNTMRSFFSGEDDDELALNTGLQNFYLSVIVNNFNEVVAAVAFATEVEKSQSEVFKYKNAWGESLAPLKSDKKVLRREAHKYMCDVEIEGAEMQVSQEFKDRFKVISEKVAMRAVKKETSGYLGFFASPNPSDLIVPADPPKISFLKNLVEGLAYDLGTLGSLEEAVEVVSEGIFIKKVCMEDFKSQGFTVKETKEEWENVIAEAEYFLSVENLEGLWMATYQVSEGNFVRSEMKDEVFKTLETLLKLANPKCELKTLLPFAIAEWIKPENHDNRG